MESINLLAGLVGVNPILVALAIIWSLVWKGLALWKSAGLRQKYWFIAILIINTLGVLEIIYIFFVAKKYKVEVIEKTE
ncbi:MAG: hypothetical protein COV96_00850 [Candidatus Zambryskibacteria bacterium CG11_big_fil_rev_8_21_14_0_20_42_18]|uniref:DUF5652 domain-containing protein n=1 Tax=Candidatus Zambryskibacteria bacterium CG_4_9_14_3_um_filter_42_15 TaxID=1975112 RepID=A0A2M7WSL8_9BACT|nr:MAG: hypothetical protein COV96_00850 [Candidatus Zambryskibacteria bacterium CG11_big_fil_rev_8_21_14_0_20_42_18]PJA32998.1 MAG: hypothetical protein CO185_01040 [Candidatus Zambryskibacteria bacterium CG_4_9_14_3_um_filter_42_15]